MEQFDSYRFDSYRRQQLRGAFVFRSNAGMVPGLILVGIGALFFLNNLHIIYVREWFKYWPAILIAAGIVKLVDSDFSGGRACGGILAGVGAILIARNLGYIDFGWRDMWPLLLIGFGVLLLIQRTGEFHLKVRAAPMVTASEPSGPAEGASVSAHAIFGGSKRIITSQDFRGGEAVAIFGGIELDLRQAGMTADSATLDIQAMFGGVELKIPRNWSAVVEGIGIFGGYADNTIQPEPVAGFPPKKLIVKGVAAFGGVDVKN